MLSDSYYRAIAAVDYRALLPDVIPTMVYRKQSGRYAVRFFGMIEDAYRAFEDWKRDHHVNPRMVYAFIVDDDFAELFVELETDAEIAVRVANAIPVQLRLFAA